MPITRLPPEETLSTREAARHIVFFQIKLFVDAARDLVFSPISFIAFLVDAFTRPKVEESLSYKVMLLGRRSDRMINLFSEYSDQGSYTIDETVKEVETAIERELARKKKEQAEAKARKNRKKLTG